MKVLKEQKGLKDKKGITLIALVVTIVVLIVLATVSILAVFGDNGIITRAQKAKDTHEEGKADETNTLDDYASYIGQYLDEINAIKPTIVAKPATWTSNNVTPIDGGDGKAVPLPNGFYYIGGDISTGLVISDKKGDKIDASGVDMGNQFVWIPVSGEADLERTLFDEKYETMEGNELTIADYSEPYENGYATEAEEYNTMKAKVLEYGGFYIGRCEAGVNSTTFREYDAPVQTVVCKKGVAPYTFVFWGESMSSIGTTGAAYLAKNMYASSSSVTSTVTYGCQWDAMCRYIGDSQRRVSRSSLKLTGSLESDVSKRIYDLAGNCQEWTMEYGTGYGRILRGGGYDGTYRINERYYDMHMQPCEDERTFRPTLYIK